ncbi:CHAT domain-containing protein [Nodosilinea sp. AN01ver1]|uniref:CHAT domain-containing protein n=1 Tax=Nodosilinea sp. AN01ver1 TaxID=3423362 RepID=UPI003D320B9D
MNNFNLNAFDLSDPQRTISQLDHEILELYQNGEIERAIQLAASINQFTKQIWEDRLEQYYEISLSLNIFSLDKMAWLYRTIEDFSSAEICYQEVLKVRRDVLGENHPHAIQSLKNLILFYKEIGETIKAEPFLLELTEIRSNILGSRSPEFAGDLIQLAEFYREIENYDRAEKIFLEALDICRNAFGEVHLAVAACLDQLSTLYSAKENFAEAIPPLQQASDIWRRLQGDTSLSVALSLSNLAFLHEKIGDSTNAISLYHEALEAYQKIQGKELEVADLLEKLVKLYYSRNDYRQALPLCREVLELRNQMQVKNEFKIAGDTVILANLYARLGKLEKARGCLNSIDDFYQSKDFMDNDCLDKAALFSNLAHIYFEVGDYKKAVDFYESSLKSLKYHFEVDIHELKKTISQHYDQYDEPNAIAHPSFWLISNSLMGLGMIHLKMGDFVKAERLFNEVKEIYHTVLGAYPSSKKESLEIASLYDQLGLIYKTIGGFDESRMLYELGLDISKELGSDYADLSVGDFDRSLYFYFKAIDIYKKIKPNSIGLYGSLFNLAGLCRVTGRPDVAKALLEESLQIHAMNEESSFAAKALHSLAITNYLLGDYESAKKCCSESLKLYKKYFGEKHPDISLILFLMADAHVATGNIDEAFSFMKSSESILDESIGHIFSFNSEDSRTSYLQQIKCNLDFFISFLILYFPRSLSKLEFGFELVLRRKAIGIEVLVVQQNIFLAERYPHLKSRLNQLIQLRNLIGQKVLSGLDEEGISAHQKKLERWNQKKDQIEAELTRQIPEMDVTQKLRSVSLSEISASLPHNSTLLEFMRFRFHDFKAISEKGQNQRYTEHYAVFILSLNKVEPIQLVDLGEADLIDQMIKTFRVFITHDREESNKTLVNYGQEAAERHARAEIPLSSPLIHNGLELRAKIFDPLLPAIGNCKHLFLAPDGDLTLIPFEVLPTDCGQLLIDHYTISYLSTGRDFLRFNAPSSEPTLPIVAADPDFDLEGSILGSTPSSESKEFMAVENANRSNRYSQISRDFYKGMYFERLKGTSTEGKQIAKLLNVKPWLGSDVRELRLKACRSPKILHIATHGFFVKKTQSNFFLDEPYLNHLGTTQSFNEALGTLALNGFIPVDRDGNEIFYERLSGLGIGLNNPLLRTGLALAGANTWLKNGILPEDAEDAILTAEDVTAMNLMGTEMVVLSACETALGEVQPGEGVFGLRRSFVLAGAKTLVMSLWKVPDKQTQELMEDFYKRILAGQPRAEALRGAQLDMKKKYPNPYYWGAFICQGDPSPLKTLPSSAAQHD